VMEMKSYLDRIAMWKAGQTRLHWFCAGAIYGRKLWHIAYDDIHAKSGDGDEPRTCFYHDSNVFNRNLMEFDLI